MLESKKDISHIIFGGTSGIGALLAKKLSERGLGVAITGRRPEAKVSGELSYLQANFSDSSDYETVKFYIRDQPALSHFIFNVGGSFGRHERFPSVENFQYLAYCNLLYIMEILNFLIETDTIKNKNFSFMLTTASENLTGNPAYVILKKSLLDLTIFLERNLSESGVGIARILLPLILYEDRYLASEYLKLNSDQARKTFIEDNLDGFAPVRPDKISEEIVELILRLDRAQPLEATWAISNGGRYG